MRVNNISSGLIFIRRPPRNEFQGYKTTPDKSGLWAGQAGFITTQGNAYLHLPGVIVTETISEAQRYLLSDGLGSIRQALDETAQVVTYREFDPYGNPNYELGTMNPEQSYGYTGEWWADDVGLLYLRTRWYAPQDGVFLSRDPVEGEPPYLYVRGNPVNLVDPTGKVPIFPEHCRQRISKEDCVWCVLGYYNLKYTAEPPEGYGFTQFIVNVDDITGEPGCWQGPVPYLAGGYAEGASAGIGSFRKGREVVYNWATMERQAFDYKGLGFSIDALGVGSAVDSYYTSAIGGFRSNKNIYEEYKGDFIYFSNGLSIGPSMVG